MKKLGNSIMAGTLALGIGGVIPQKAQAESWEQTTSDIATVALPVAGAACHILRNNQEGAVQALTAPILAQGIVTGFKKGLQDSNFGQRPNGGDQGGASGHVAGGISGAISISDCVGGMSHEVHYTTKLVIQGVTLTLAGVVVYDRLANGDHSLGQVALGALSSVVADQVMTQLNLQLPEGTTLHIGALPNFSILRNSLASPVMHKTMAPPTSLYGINLTTQNPGLNRTAGLPGQRGVSMSNIQARRGLEMPDFEGDITLPKPRETSIVVGSSSGTERNTVVKAEETPILTQDTPKTYSIYDSFPYDGNIRFELSFGEKN